MTTIVFLLLKAENKLSHNNALFLCHHLTKGSITAECENELLEMKL